MANLVGSSSTSHGLTSLQAELSSSLMHYTLSSENINSPKKNCFALEAISLLLSNDQPQLQQESFVNFLVQSEENKKSPLLSIISEVLNPISKFSTLTEQEWILNLLCTIIERIFTLKPSLSNALLPEISSICGDLLNNKSIINSQENILVAIVSILYSTFLHCESIQNHTESHSNNNNNNNNNNNQTLEIILSTLTSISLCSSIASATSSVKAGWILSIIIYKV